MTDWATIREAAAILGVSEGRLYNASVLRGNIACRRNAGTWQVDLESAELYLTRPTRPQEMKAMLDRGDCLADVAREFGVHTRSVARALQRLRRKGAA